MATNNPSWWLVPNPGQSVKLDLPEPFFKRYNDPIGYKPSASLISAVNVALLLGQPLLLTGEPGCGKTTLAYWLADQLGVGEPLVVTVKSSTTGRDLLYNFDEVARFRDARKEGAVWSELDYLELNALGLAIVASAGPDRPVSRSGLTRAGDALLYHRDLHRSVLPSERRQVVLIDELDKAHRDTPNDILTEIERMEFHIPELSATVKGDEAFRPVVVVTSNSDKSLPEPFLRRCVFHHIETPDSERRAEIIASRRPRLLVARGHLFDEANDLFERIKLEIGLNGRQPGTAEFLAWLDVLFQIYPADTGKLMDSKVLLRTSLSVLCKSRDDELMLARQLGLG